MGSNWKRRVELSLLVFLMACPLAMAGADVRVAAGPAGNELSLAGAVFHRTSSPVSNLSVIDVPGSSTQLVLWNEVAWDGTIAPFYAISLDGRTVARVTQTQHEIATRLGQFDPLQGAVTMVPGLAADANTNVHIVQFVTQPLPEFRSEIERLGGVIREYQPYHAYLVEMTPATRSAVAGLPYVRSITPYQPAFRLDESLLRNAPAPGQKEILPVQRYNIRVGDPLQRVAVAERIKQIGGYVDKFDAGKRLMVATLSREQLYTLAHWDEVLFVDRWSPMEKDMNNAREFGGANYIETNAPAHYRGQGVRAEVFDAGFNLAHVDFQSRPLIAHGTVGSDSHGASTSGIVFGDGTGNALARGMLPAAQGVAGDYNTIGLNGPTRRQHTYEETQAPYFCVFETSSVGDPQITTYSNISADTDDDLFDFDIVHCQSQSNTGNQTSRPQAWAKNIISGGAHYHYDTLDPNDDRWAGGASIGPASDGRIKPDLCGYYDMILTTTGPGTNAYTTDFGGTSGATPMIAGHVGLFFQMWADGIFGNTIDPGGTVFDNRCHMTTAKAMMINNARQYRFPGGPNTDTTRFNQGWGWPNLRRIYDMRDKMFVVDESVALQSLQSIVYVLNVEPAEPEFRATLVYADPAGNPNNQARHAVNAMSLKVTAPDGTIYKGNMGLKTGNYSTANPPDPNWIDTVQNVFVANPATGAWVVEVKATEVVQDGHVETPELDVDFSLVVSGVTPCSAAGVVSLDRSLYPCDGLATIHVIDCDLNLDPNAPDTVMIQVASTSEPAGEAVVLTETGLATASFTGILPFSTTNAPGVLWVAHGDTITATYIDADNGQGGHNVVVTDTGLVDCIPPQISDVQVSNIQAHTASIAFACDEPARGTVHYGTDCGNLNQTTSGGSFDLDPMITLTGLLENTTYYFAVDATDQAGNTSSDPNCYTFATPDIPNYFTELFTAFDLANLSLQFVPNGSEDFYAGCREGILTLPTDPNGGTPLALTDDSFATVNLTGGAHVYLYGTAYTTFFVGSNGYITFATGDTTLTISYAAHFSQPRVSALMRDLNPSVGGQVSWKQLADRAVVTWLNVPCYSNCGPNTFQIELLFNGQININYLTIAATDGLAGLSHGNTQPPDFEPSDLSTMLLCGEHPPTAVGNTVVIPVETPTSVLLVAIDDGLPDPPAAVIIRITSLPTHGTLADPGAGPITTVPYDLIAYGDHVIYTPEAGFYSTDTFQFQADDGGVPPTGGPSNIATETLNVQFGPPVITTTALPNACLDHNYNFQMQASQGQPPLAWSIVATGSYVEADLGNNQFTATGTAQNWRNDDQSWPYTLPFTFPYYGVNRTTVNVCSNGFLDFTSNTTAYQNSDAGLLAAVRIAPLWDDLMTNFNASDDIYIDATIPNQVTIRWLGVTYTGHIAVNFAVTLYADGRIQFHYGPGNTGLTPTIGISKGDSADYVLSTYNNAASLTNANSHEFSQTSPLPPNITLSAAGLLSGVPTVTGTFTPHIKVTDALNRSAEQTFTLVVDATCGLLGDMNCDGFVTFDDINPFVAALSCAQCSSTCWPPEGVPADCPCMNADCNGDGHVDFDDINSFVEILSGGGK